MWEILTSLYRIVDQLCPPCGLLIAVIMMRLAAAFRCKYADLKLKREMESWMKTETAEHWRD